jgi:mannosyl-3-phosphoglycerate phosphatase family protein
MKPRLLVFTDLDGSLLDHHSYRWDAAADALRQLREAEIPLILASSKTRAEMLPLQSALGLRHPIIVENGAAIVVPSGTFREPLPEALPCGDGQEVRFAPPRDRWLALLNALAAEFTGEFAGFERLGIDGIVAATGLDADAAALAAKREFSEPVQWLGTPERRAQFVDALEAAGARVQQGGRFLTVAGDCDKGQALRYLRSAYRYDAPGRPLHDLAIGDSGNDVPMLEAAETALLVRSPTHDFPPLARTTGVLRSTGLGPAGWREGVLAWLHHYTIAGD